MERKSAEDRDGGLPGKTGFNGADESHDRKIHPPLAIRQDTLPFPLLPPLQRPRVFCQLHENSLALRSGSLRKTMKQRLTRLLSERREEQILPLIDNFTREAVKLF